MVTNFLKYKVIVLQILNSWMNSVLQDNEGEIRGGRGLATELPTYHPLGLFAISL